MHFSLKLGSGIYHSGSSLHSSHLLQCSHGKYKRQSVQIKFGGESKSTNESLCSYCSKQLWIVLTIKMQIYHSTLVQCENIPAGEVELNSDSHQAVHPIVKTTYFIVI